MLNWLIVLVLLAIALCPAAPPLAVVAAGTAVAIIAGPFADAAGVDCAVAARSAGDAARRDRAEGVGCAGGGSVTAVGPGAIAPDLRAAGVVAAGGVDYLPVARLP